MNLTATQKSKACGYEGPSLPAWSQSHCRAVPQAELLSSTDGCIEKFISGCHLVFKVEGWNRQWLQSYEHPKNNSNPVSKIDTGCRQTNTPQHFGIGSPSKPCSHSQTCIPNSTSAFMVFFAVTFCTCPWEKIAISWLSDHEQLYHTQQLLPVFSAQQY